MINWIDDNIHKQPNLLDMSKEIGYSPCYCSNLFHKVTGMTLKKYLANRKLAFVATALRDTDQRILDITLDYGYTSQQSLSRAFSKSFGLTPLKYRKNPVPINYHIKQQVLLPNHYIHKGDKNMNHLKAANVKIEYLPGHKYIGIWEKRAKDYGDFWKYHNCDDITGIIDSMRHVALEVVGCHMAGWFSNNHETGYFYGFGVSLDYDGPIPDGFEVKEFPASTYMVFYHPPYDYVSENSQVMKRVHEFANNFNPSKNDTWWIPDAYEWNPNCQTYQRHFPEVLGYEILKPVKKINTK